MLYSSLDCLVIMKNTVSFFLAAILLAACTTAQTARPQLTQAELQREQQIQERLAREQGSREVVQAETVVLQDRHIKRVKPLAKEVSKAGKNFCADLGRPPERCDYKIVITKDGPVNAFADGQRVIITPAMVDATENNDELAFILAHEYAHNIMNHVAATRQNVGLGALLGIAADQLLGSQGLQTGGQLGKLGAQVAQLRYSQGFEQEADYVGLYILARTPYKLENAPDYWRRASVKNKEAIYTAVTHPTNPERFVQMQKTIDEIQEKQAAGEPLIPSFKEQQEYGLLSAFH